MSVYLRQNEIQPGTLIIAPKGLGSALVLTKPAKKGPYSGWVKILELDTGEIVQANASYLRRAKSGGSK
jgi:hypothetical protein|tara:strand:- start:654 stop:860 length:207 start_codon:yes stop_codon:yes gene_type:complete